MSEHKVALSKGVTMEPQEILKRPYARVLTPEPDGQYTAEIMEFPGCVAYGNTAAEALTKLDEVALEWLAASIEQGQSIPEPFSAMEYSGKLVVRMPKGLHQRAALSAEREGVSLNQFIVACLAEAVGERSRAPVVPVEPARQVRVIAALQDFFPIPQREWSKGRTLSYFDATGTAVIKFKEHAVNEAIYKKAKIHARG
jgi:predicted RNase H-like HicB family nuclease